MGDPIDLREGRWQDVLPDVTCDALIVDAPYSERTHSTHGRSGASAAVCYDERTGKTRANKAPKPINYECWKPEDVAAFVDFWAPRTRGWFVTITDHSLAPHWEAALASSGRYVFSPLAFIANGSRIRLAGDGPSQWCCWIVVARPKNAVFHRWGTLPGGYVLPPGEAGNAVVGGKPLWLMRALVRDYSRPGDLICDPCAGGGTTLLAAATEGRRAVGAEMDPKHYEIARKRIAKGYTPTLFSAASAQPEQLTIGGDE